MSDFLNKKRVRDFILAEARETRAHPFTRISDEWYAYLEAVLKTTVSGSIRAHPSVGRTLYPPTHKSTKEA